jgi:hypothetical protein
LLLDAELIDKYADPRKSPTDTGANGCVVFFAMAPENISNSTLPRTVLIAANI